MNITNLTTETIYKHTSNIIDTIESLLPHSIYLTDKEILNQVTDTLHFNQDYIRTLFKFATDITIIKYIKRRKYTVLLSQMTSADFDTLNQTETKFGIKNFKSKCLKEFPNLKYLYSTVLMQPIINKKKLPDNIEKNFIKCIDGESFQKCYNKITENRTIYEIKDFSRNIIIQNNNKTFLHPEKICFKYGDKLLLLKSCLSESINEQLKVLYNYISNNTAPNYLISNIYIECIDLIRKSYATKGLISHNESTIILTTNPFIVFNNDNIELNFDFLKKQNI